MDSFLGKSRSKAKNRKERGPFFIVMGRYFRGISRGVKKKVWAMRNIQMAHFIWAILPMVGEMVVENSNGKMVRSMTANGETTKNLEAESGKAPIAYLTSANGKTIPSKGSECC